MGFWDVVTGRNRRPAPNLDALFAVPAACVTLETSLGLAPAGMGAVCYRAVDGRAFDEAEAEIGALLAADPATPDLHPVTDDFGFTWLVVHEADPGELCTHLHAVNTTLVDRGFGTGLLCTLVPFTGPEGPLALVYLFKQGTFYPFAPVPGERRRNTLLELRIRDAAAGELPLEPDLSRWLALWGAPGL